MDQSCSSQDHRMDLSMKEQFVLVEFPGADPGSEFEIVNKNRLNIKIRDKLEGGEEVFVRFGCAKTQAFVILESEDYSTLERRIEILTEKKKPPQRFDEYPKYVIKVRDQGIQTEPDPKMVGLSSQHNDLKLRHEALFNLIEDLKGDMKNVAQITNGDVDVPMTTVTEVKMSPAVLQAVNREMSERRYDDVRTDEDTNMVHIGKYETPVAKDMFDNVNWLSYSAATRSLLVSVFPRIVLATHSLTGKPSPAFLKANKQAKKKLDHEKVSDIVEIVSCRCGVKPAIVRGVITTKCADENKMYRQRMERHGKENTAQEIKKQEA